MHRNKVQDNSISLLDSNKKKLFKHSKNSQNWLVCILSTLDLRSFRDINLLVKMYNEKSFGMIIITVGIDKDKPLSKLKNFLSFNRQAGQDNYSLHQEFKFLKDPTDEQIKELISSISTLEAVDEHFIYERFD